MAKRECLTSSAEVSKRRDVRLDVKIVVSDCESGDIVWQQTRNNSSRNTWKKDTNGVRPVLEFVIKLVPSVFLRRSQTSRRGRRRTMLASRASCTYTVRHYCTYTVRHYEYTIWQQTRNNSSETTEKGHHWSTPCVRVRRKIGSCRSRRGRRKMTCIRHENVCITSFLYLYSTQYSQTSLYEYMSSFPQKAGHVDNDTRLNDLHERYFGKGIVLWWCRSITFGQLSGNKRLMSPRSLNTLVISLHLGSASAEGNNKRIEATRGHYYHLFFYRGSG